MKSYQFQLGVSFLAALIFTSNVLAAGVLAVSPSKPYISWPAIDSDGAAAEQRAILYCNGLGKSNDCQVTIRFGRGQCLGYQVSADNTRMIHTISTSINQANDRLQAECKATGGCAGQPSFACDDK